MIGLSVEEAAKAMSGLARAAGGDPDGTRTIGGAKAAYVRGDIELDEFERRVGEVLDGTAARRRQECLRERCDRDGHDWLEVSEWGGETRRICAVCGDRQP